MSPRARAAIRVSHDVGGTFGGGQADENIGLESERLDLPRKDVVKAVIIADSAQRGYYGGACFGIELPARALTPVCHHSDGLQTLRIVTLARLALQHYSRRFALALRFEP
jgi:hypothetical protein